MLYVLEAQGSLPRGQALLYVRRTSISLGRAVRTMYRGTLGARLLRRLAAAPVANGYLSEAKGRSMPGTPGFARPRDIPRERQAVLRVRIERG